MRRGGPALVLGAALALPAASAERFDHQGSLWALAAPGGALSVSSSAIVVPVNGIRWVALLGGGAAFDHEGHELTLLARMTGRSGALDLAGMLGVRASFGDERWRTFVDLQLAVTFVPALLAGPRFGGGVQYELSPVTGAFCGGAIQIGMGAALMLTVDVTCGLQLRTYVL